jgi:HD-GYP domain-containing protein (c-di-GMP phosphodiesterase class II)
LAVRQPDALARAEIAGALAKAVAAELADPPQAALIPEAARLQEVGKLYVPASILATPLAALAETDRLKVNNHHEHGMKLAAGAGVPRRACAMILHAREHYDGSGPGGLAADEIPIGSRIVAAAAEYLDAPLLPGAATGDPREVAIARLDALSGSRLDPDVVLAATRAAGATRQN